MVSPSYMGPSTTVVVHLFRYYPILSIHGKIRIDQEVIVQLTLFPYLILPVKPDGLLGIGLLTNG